MGIFNCNKNWHVVLNGGLRQNSRESRLFGILFVIFAHAVLLYWLAEKDIVATLFAAGDHIPWFSLVLAITFIALRFIVIVTLPGIFMIYLTKAVIRRRLI